MVGTIVHQLTKNASIEEVEKGGLAPYYTDRHLGVYPQSAGGTPFTAAYATVLLRILFCGILSNTTKKYCRLDKDTILIFIYI